MSTAQNQQGAENPAMNQHLRSEPIPFIDVASQRRRLGTSLDEAVKRVMDHCQFVNGPEVFELEKQLAAYSGAKHVIGCASGTDAILMVMMAKNVGPGDAVLCPSFTFIATASPVARTGATPVYVDVDETTFNMRDMELMGLFAQQAAMAIDQSQQIDLIQESMVRALKQLAKADRSQPSVELRTVLDESISKRKELVSLLELADLFNKISALGEDERNACIQILNVFAEFRKPDSSPFRFR